MNSLTPHQIELLFCLFVWVMMPVVFFGAMGLIWLINQTPGKYAYSINRWLDRVLSKEGL